MDIQHELNPAQFDRWKRTMLAMTPEEKWAKVKGYYEKCYNVTFEKKPAPEKIEFLFSEMMKLTESIQSYLWEARPVLYQLLAEQKKHEADEA